jgi:hypothetical protein
LPMQRCGAECGSSCRFSLCFRQDRQPGSGVLDQGAERRGE